MSERCDSRCGVTASVLACRLAKPIEDLCLPCRVVIREVELPREDRVAVFRLCGASETDGDDTSGVNSFSFVCRTRHACYGCIGMGPG